MTIIMCVLQCLSWVLAVCHTTSRSLFCLFLVWFLFLDLLVWIWTLVCTGL